MQRKCAFLERLNNYLKLMTQRLRQTPAEVTRYYRALEVFATKSPIFVGIVLLGCERVWQVVETLTTSG